MSFHLPIKAAIFDMDGLLIDSEPYWTQGEKEVFSELGLDFSLAEKLPDTLGLRIDQVVELWYQASPWQGASKSDVEQRITDHVIDLVKENRPLLPGVEYALNLSSFMPMAASYCSHSSRSAYVLFCQTKI